MEPIERLKLHLLGELLHLANSHPPFLQRHEFYQMKDRILRQYGQADGFDVQHIVKDCWLCDGTGEDKEIAIVSFGKHWKGAPCRRCKGTKIYQQFWTHLLRFKIGRHTFHLPEKRYDTHPWLDLQRPMIEGYIRHEVPRYYLAHEAFFWLTLFFDRDLFRRSFGRFGMPARKFTPMVILANTLWKIRHIPNDLYNAKIRLGMFIQQIKQKFCKHDFTAYNEVCLYDECPKCAIYRWQTFPGDRYNEEFPF